MTPSLGKYVLLHADLWLADEVSRYLRLCDIPMIIETEINGGLWGDIYFM